MSIADEVERIAHAFNDGDGRKTMVRDLARSVAELEARALAAEANVERLVDVIDETKEYTSDMLDAHMRNATLGWRLADLAESIARRALAEGLAECKLQRWRAEVAEQNYAEALTECERLRILNGDIINAIGIMVDERDDLPTAVRQEVKRLKGTHWKDEQGQWVLSDEQAIRADERERWANLVDDACDWMVAPVARKVRAFHAARIQRAAALRGGKGE